MFLREPGSVPLWKINGPFMGWVHLSSLCKHLTVLITLK